VFVSFLSSGPLDLCRAAEDEDVASLKRICVLEVVAVIGAGGRKTSDVISRTMMDFIDGWVWTSWRR
jgi:hypothetical protein